MIKITTTYQVVSPESAEVGDVEDQGFHDEQGEVFKTPQEATDFITKHNAYIPSESPSDNAKWWSTDGDEDYTTGFRTYYSYHINTDTDTLKEVNTILMGQ